MPRWLEGAHTTSGHGACRIRGLTNASLIFAVQVKPRIGNGMLLKGPEVFECKRRFNPFEDEPCLSEPATLSPDMTEFLLPDLFNANPFPDHGQWDEGKGMLPTLKPRVAHLASRVKATNDGPIIHQPRPLSYKDLNDALRNILEYAEAAEDDNATGAYDRAAGTVQAPVPTLNSLGLNFTYDNADASSDGYSTDASDFFDVPSETSSTETTPDNPEVLLKPSPVDAERLVNMHARGKSRDVRGLELQASEFKPTPLKKGTTALDLLKAIQVGSDLPFKAQAPIEEFKPTLLKENTTALDLFKAIQVGGDLSIASADAGKQQERSPIPRSAYPPTPLIGEPVSLPATTTSLLFPDLDEEVIDETPLLDTFP